MHLSWRSPLADVPCVTGALLTPSPPPPQVPFTKHLHERRTVVYVQVNKDDLLSMVRYGAELVFSSEASNITGGSPEPGRGSS